MDRVRLDELMEKRRVRGLSDDEANELGRLMAEDAGVPYGNAARPPQDVERERDGTPAEDSGADDPTAIQGDVPPPA